MTCDQKAINRQFTTCYLHGRQFKRCTCLTPTFASHYLTVSTGNVRQKLCNAIASRNNYPKILASLVISRVNVHLSQIQVELKIHLSTIITVKASACLQAIYTKQWLHQKVCHCIFTSISRIIINHIIYRCLNCTILRPSLLTSNFIFSLEKDDMIVTKVTKNQMSGSSLIHKQHATEYCVGVLVLCYYSAF